MIVLKQSKSILNKVLPIDLSHDDNNKSDISRKSSIHDARTTINEIQHNHNHTNTNGHGHGIYSPLPGDSRRNSREIKFNLINPDISSPSPPSSVPSSGDEGISPTRKNSSRKPSRKNSVRRPRRNSATNKSDTNAAFKKTKEVSLDSKIEPPVADKNAKDVVNELTKFDWILIGIIIFLVLLIYYF